jgi:hypothetical protein
MPKIDDRPGDGELVSGDDAAPQLRGGVGESPSWLRVVPKGHWRLAGGANHRFGANIKSGPQGDYLTNAAGARGTCVTAVRTTGFMMPPVGIHSNFGKYQQKCCI